MAYEADKVVVQLIADNSQFDGNVKSSAAAYEDSMDRIKGSAEGAEKAHGHLALATNNSRIAMLEFQHVARGATDQLAAGAPLTQIMTQHLGQLAQAVSLAGGAFGALGEFLGGPLGIALTLATVLLAKFALGGKEATTSVDDLVKKLKEHYDRTNMSADAQRIWAQTVEGSIEAVRKLSDEIEKQNRTLQDNINLTKAQTAAAQANVANQISTTSAQLAAAVQQMYAARSELLRNQGAAGDPNVSPDVAAAYSAAQHNFAAAQQQVLQLSAQLLNLKTAADTASKSLRDVDLPLIEQRAQDSVNPIKAINDKFDELAAKAKKAGTYTQAFANDLEAQRKAAIDTAQANERLSKSNIYSGKQIGFDQAASIARGAGYQVNSAQRSYADQKRLYDAWVAQGMPKDNPVAPPGTSAHEGAKGRWALDIQIKGDAKLEAANLKKLYGDQGVDVNVFPERGHLHVSGSRSQAAADDSAAEREAQRQAQLQARDANLLAGLNERYAKALADLAAGTEDSAEQQKAAIDKERDAEDQHIAGMLKTQQIDAATAKEATRVNDATAELAKQLVDRAASERKIKLDEEQRQRDLSVAEAINQNQQDVLHGQEDLARTQAERRDIELKILELAFQEEALREKSVIAARDALAAELAKRKPDEISDADKARLADLNAQASIAQDRLSTAPTRYANSATSIFHQTENPLEAFFRSVPRGAQEVNEAFESIAANGLNDLASGIADAVVNFKSLGQAAMSVLKQIEGQLIQMAIKQLFSKALGGLGGLLGGGGGGGGLAGGLDFSGISDFSGVSFRAGGGPVRKGQPYVVGEHRAELFIPNQDGMIVPSISNDRAATPGGAGGGQVQVLVVPSPMFETVVQGQAAKVAAPMSGAAAVAGATGGVQAITRRAMRRIP
jgi:hypothetical protein